MNTPNVQRDALYDLLQRSGDMLHYIELLGRPLTDAELAKVAALQREIEKTLPDMTANVLEIRQRSLKVRAERLGFTITTQPGHYGLWVTNIPEEGSQAYWALYNEIEDHDKEANIFYSRQHRAGGQ